MSKLISEILNAPEPSFSHMIQELEIMSGKPGVDIKLAQEIKSLFRQKAREVGLDEDDTTTKELYYGLSKRALEDSEKLANIIGVKADDSPRKMAEKSINYVKKRIGKRDAWSIKSSVARKQLKENPPKKLMKILGMRSIDSALKRERASLFYCFARATEPSSWLAKYVAQASKLTNSDFGNQPIAISLLPANRTKQLIKSGLKLNQMTYIHYEAASIEVMAMDRRFEGDVLFLVDSLFNHIKDLLRASAYYKHFGFYPDFFSRVEKIRADGFGKVEVAGSPFGWRTLVHASSELGVPDLISVGSDTVGNVEDFVSPSLRQLAQFSLWKHPFVLYIESGLVVSSNLSDAIVNAINKTSAEDAYVGNARESLRSELFARYLQHENLRNQIAVG